MLYKINAKKHTLPYIGSGGNKRIPIPPQPHLRRCNKRCKGKTMTDKQLWAGSAVVEITPPLGISVPGSFTPYTVRTIHDPLYASALVLRNNQNAVAFVSCDLIAIETESVSAIRELAGRQSGIPTAQIHISATHTHAGPQVV